MSKFTEIVLFSFVGIFGVSLGIVISNVIIDKFAPPKTENCYQILWDKSEVVKIDCKTEL